MSAPLDPRDLPPHPTADDILNAFLDYLTATGTEPYDHQEEAILELIQDKNVILNTPTGSGKSLVAQLAGPPIRSGSSNVVSPISEATNSHWDHGPENRLHCHHPSDRSLEKSPSSLGPVC